MPASQPSSPSSWVHFVTTATGVAEPWRRGLASTACMQAHTEQHSTHLAPNSASWVLGHPRCTAAAAVQWRRYPLHLLQQKMVELRRPGAHPFLRPRHTSPHSETPPRHACKEAEVQNNSYYKGGPRLGSRPGLQAGSCCCAHSPEAQLRKKLVSVRCVLGAGPGRGTAASSCSPAATCSAYGCSCCAPAACCAAAAVALLLLFLGRMVQPPRRSWAAALARVCLLNT